MARPEVGLFTNLHYAKKSEIKFPGVELCPGGNKSAFLNIYNIPYLSNIY
jgi:hypothetical protein